MPVSPARAAAFDILLRTERESAYASELLHSKIYSRLSVADHALATELVMGVQRWRSRLDDEIGSASSQPLPKLDLEILLALRLAVYQFGWLDRIPKPAALNESVELVKRARKRSAAGFVNAVLRKLATRELASSPAEGFRAEILARDLAHPEWLVERWIQEYGIAAAAATCQYDQSIPATTIRLRAPSAEAELQKHKITLQPGKILSSARAVVAGDIIKLQALHSRCAVIQDEASQLVAALMGCDPRAMRILDCCAAPGGKTLAMADHNLQAAITAVELHAHRARLLRERILAANPEADIQVVVADSRDLPSGIGFDRVLADVPCSGTGTLARNPEIKWRLHPDDLLDLQRRQLAILRAAITQVAPGGRLIYSTCSLEREENEDVVEQVLGQQTPFRLIHCGEELERLRAAGELVWTNPGPLTRGPYLRTIPGIHPCDGFFAAILERA